MYTGFRGTRPTGSKFEMGKTHSENGEPKNPFFSFQEEKQSHKNAIAVGENAF
jgi:hypothetical protein